MSVNPNLLSNLPNLICTQIDQILPELKTCAPHAGRFDLRELKKMGLTSPAVLVSVLGAKEGRKLAGGYIEFTLSMAAYVVTKERLGLNRDIAAANICQGLMAIIPENDWDNKAYGPAKDVALQTLVSSNTKDAVVSLWAVTWDQPFTLFKAPQVPEVPLTLYVGQAPEIGTEHEGAYEEFKGTVV